MRIRRKTRMAEKPISDSVATFNRLSISRHDFEEAHQYLKLRSEELHPFIQRALVTAAVVAYARPFKGSRGNHSSRSQSFCRSSKRSDFRNSSSSRKRLLWSSDGLTSINSLRCHYALPVLGVTKMECICHIRRGGGRHPIPTVGLPPNTDHRTIAISIPKTSIPAPKCKKPNRDGWAKYKNRNKSVLAPRPGLEPGTYGLTGLIQPLQGAFSHYLPRNARAHSRPMGLTRT